MLVKAGVDDRDANPSSGDSGCVRKVRAENRRKFIRNSYMVLAQGRRGGKRKVFDGELRGYISYI
ncbi:MAG: hypothetical protein P4M08_13355 [Oligoflexia bacterium]|nr:hypothetical protein [Oligoflexia bacterium]